MKLQPLACAVIVVLGGCQQHRQAIDDQKSRRDIAALFNHWADAFQKKDVDGVMAIYAAGDTLVAYDIVPPLQFKGAAAYRKDYQDFFAQFKGPLHVEVPDMHVDVGGNVAFAFGVERLTGTLTDGTPVDMWLRYTEGLRRIDGQWRVVHEHISDPVDLATGKAVLDLKP